MSNERNMAIHRAEVGERYGDDSGWERLVSLDRQTNTLRIEVNGSVMSCNAEDVDLLIALLCKVRDATSGAKRP